MKPAQLNADWKKKNKNKSDGVIVSMWILSPDSNVLFMYYK